MYVNFREVVPPYKRIEALEIISLLERRTSNLLKTAFLDEMDDFYKTEFSFVKSKVFDIESPKALL